MGTIHGGQVIARALKREGVDVVFALTGGHILPILDGCVLEGIRIVDVRHEQAAAHAAEAYSRLTGRLGTAIVTAGPGVTDTITAVATAAYSGNPLLVIGGRHFIRQELRGGLQEMDHPRLFASITTWAHTALETGRLADYIATAARHAFRGRGSPVFLDVPLDVQADMVAETSVDWRPGLRATDPPGAHPQAVAEAIKLLTTAARPMIFAGGGLKPSRATSLLAVAETLGAPVFLNGAARGALPHGHPLLCGASRRTAFSSTDLVLAVGVDWDFRAGYGEQVLPGAQVIQVDAEPTKIGWNRPAALGIIADPGVFLSQLVEHAESFRRQGMAGWTAEIVSEEAALRQLAEAEAESDSSPVHPQRFAREVSRFFGPDAIVAVDGGDIVSTTARWLETSHPGHVLDPGPFGTLGTGAPYAMAASVVHPDRLVGIVYGDGAFGFNGFEYDTLIRHQLPVVGVVGNDGVWNNIKTFHRAFYPDRLVATDLGVRPYHAMVAGLGGYGEFVDRPDQIRPALERALASGLPALVNVAVAETIRASSNYQQ